MRYQRDEAIKVLLRAYFDDSGTHASSEVVVLAGLIGAGAQWDSFKRQWAEKLTCPLPGKPTLKRFHLSACNARDGEFQSYNDAEQDAVIHDFRQIIIDTKLTSIATGIDKRAWHELIVGPIRDVLGEPLVVCFVNCIDETIRIAEPQADGHQIEVVFDQGIETERLREIAAAFIAPSRRLRVDSVGFARVEDVLPLQGAYIVATENYWHAAQWLKFGDAALPRPHLRHYLANMLHQGQILDRDGIEMELRRRGPDGRVP
jgi:hypothetical protein